MNHRKDELNEAKVAITSLLSKCKKALPNLKENSSHQTLLERRIKALKIALNLIEKEQLESTNN
ncbi:hypothetical protein NU10_13765 [Flavobacterium dauae]|uniref:hypothetical protein n=1 Tax=Flavobacterium dauae TaxID=1563479 RepID=UPI00101B2CF3|nr:hypothetical protein [Flavobacterium dauae]WLD23754.1 hypothetical protein NU10_13765 [Flavobacterium dauae]